MRAVGGLGGDGLRSWIRALHRALLQAGAPSLYVGLPATEHVFVLVLPQVSPAAQAAWHDADRFLALLARGT